MKYIYLAIGFPMWVLVLVYHYTGQNIIPGGLEFSAWVGVFLSFDIIHTIYKRRQNATK